MAKITSIQNLHTRDFANTDIEIEDEGNLISVKITGLHECSELINRIERAVAREINKRIKISLDFIPTKYQAIFLEWLHYKSAKNQSYKSQKSLELCFQKLYEISFGNLTTMQKIINEAMSNNWAGFFPLKENKTDGNKQQIGNLKDQYRSLLSATPTDNNNGLLKLNAAKPDNSKGNDW